MLGINFFQSLFIIFILARFTFYSSTQMPKFRFTKTFKREDKITFWALFIVAHYVSFGAMKRCMKFHGCKFKIFNTVIKFIPVFMMNNLNRKRLKLSAKTVFHHKAMFHDLFSINAHPMITMFCDIARSLSSYFECMWRAIFAPAKPMLNAISSTVMFIFATFNFAYSHINNMPLKLVYGKENLL